MNNAKQTNSPTKNQTRSGVPLGFTLVELIVVVTILAILATIGFVSYSSYLTGVRDTNRLAQLVAIHDGMELYRTKNDLPLPDENISILANTNVIAYQGYAGSNTLETIDFTKGGKDPKDGDYFSYYLTADRKYFQLLAFLEEEENLSAQNPFTPSPLRRGLGGGLANAADLSNRISTVYGKKLGVMTDSDNTPIQELVSGSIDLVAQDTTGYVAHLTDTSTLTGSTAGNSDLAYLEGAGAGGGVASSCKTIIDRNNSIKGKDGVYLIDPEGNSPFPVYCEMTTDNGGWTLVDNMASNSDTFVARTAGANLDLTTTNGSFLPYHLWSGAPQILCKADYYDGSKNWVTINVESDQIKLYPTANLAIGGGALGHVSKDDLNGNTYQAFPGGLGVYYATGLWLGYGSSSTCSCGYSGTTSGVGGHSASIRICSTWVR